MRKYIVTKFHMLQFIYENPLCYRNHMRRFFHCYTRSVYRSVQDLITQGYVEKVPVQRTVKQFIALKTTSSGDRFIHRHNDNVCKITSSTARLFLQRYPECICPTTLDVNWGETSRYVHPNEVTRI